VTLERVERRARAAPTCGRDIRSIFLHDEVVSVIYDSGVATEYAAQYERDMAECVEVDLEDLESLGALVTFRNSVYCLYSRLL
jgi:hypothetical protein